MRSRTIIPCTRSTWRQGEPGVETESMRLSWGSGKIYSVRTVIYKHYCINEIFWECENIKSVKNDKDYLSKSPFRNLKRFPSDDWIHHIFRFAKDSSYLTKMLKKFFKSHNVITAPSSHLNQVTFKPIRFGFTFTKGVNFGALD